MTGQAALNPAFERLTALAGGPDAPSLHDRMEAAELLGREVNAFSACLPVLLAALGCDRNLRALSESIPYKPSRFHAMDIINTLAEMGYGAKSMRLSLNDIDTRLLPCLFISGQTPFVVLGHSAEGWNVFDGSKRGHARIPAETEVRGRAYFFRKRDGTDLLLSGEARTATNLTWFRALIERFRGMSGQVIGVSIVLNLTAIFVPLLIMTIYDRVVGSHALASLPSLGIGLFIALVAETSLRFLRARYLSWISVRLDTVVNNAIIAHLLRLPAALIERASVASQIARIKGFEAIRDFFTGPLFLSLMELPFVAVLLAAIALLGGWLALVPAIMALVYAGIFFFMRSRIKIAMYRTARAHANRQQALLETFETLSALRYNGMSEAWEKRFRDISGEASHAAFRSGYLSSVLETTAHTLTIFAGVLTLLMGVDFVLAGAMSPGALVASMMLTWRVLSPVSMLCTALPRIEQVSQTVSQVNRLMDIAPETTAETSIARLACIKGKIAFNNIGLRYSKDTDPVFAGLTFTVQAGQMAAITGTNGSGKSTILKLINGLYQAQAGTIRLDGIDIRQIDPVELRRHIAYMPQTPDLFDGTIAENLRLADPLASEESLLEALEEAGAAAEIDKLPEGIHTHVSSQNRFSMTLAYRINFARLSLSCAPVVLCDELPFAVLNSETGEAFRQLIAKWRGRRTVVMVTHRQDYIGLADVAICLRTGDRPRIGTAKEILTYLKDISYQVTGQ